MATRLPGLVMIGGLIACAALLLGAVGDYGGIAPRAVKINPDNTGLAIWPPGAVPLNPSGAVPFALSVLGDVIAGDLYCIDQGGPGCVYGRSASTATGPRLYQSNRFINAEGGTGGPGLVLWPDVPNSDGAGHRGYGEFTVWGQTAAGDEWSNSFSIAQRGPNGEHVRRFKVMPDGRLHVPAWMGGGLRRVCVDDAGMLAAGSGC